jgi:hypothetical protein
LPMVCITRELGILKGANADPIPVNPYIIPLLSLKYVKILTPMDTNLGEIIHILDMVGMSMEKQNPNHIRMGKIYAVKSVCNPIYHMPNN